MKLLGAFFTLLTGIVLFIGCARDDDQVTPLSRDYSNQKIAVIEDGNECQDLMAGQHMDAGDVCVSIIESNLSVTYSTNGNWQMNEIHLWVGMNLMDMPVNKTGNPQIGKFPYSMVFMDGMNTYQFIIPLQDLGIVDSSDCDYRIYLAAHAVVEDSFRTETAWGNGEQILDGGSWATYWWVNFTCEDDNNGGGSNTCETAFAYSQNNGICFIGADFNLDGVDDGFNRWGWTNEIQSTGTYTLDIYAAAGQCDITKGTMVGTLSIDYNGSSADVTFNMNQGFYMNETHLYIGSEPLATDPNGNFTVAPGQYPNIHNLSNATSDSYFISGLSGPQYVVAHAVVCGDY